MFGEQTSRTKKWIRAGIAFGSISQPGRTGRGAAHLLVDLLRDGLVVHGHVGVCGGQHQLHEGALPGFVVVRGGGEGEVREAREVSVGAIQQVVDAEGSLQVVDLGRQGDGRLNLQASIFRQRSQDDASRQIDVGSPPPPDGLVGESPWVINEAVWDDDIIHDATMDDGTELDLLENGIPKKEYLDSRRSRLASSCDKSALVFGMHSGHQLWHGKGRPWQCRSTL